MNGQLTYRTQHFEAKPHSLQSYVLVHAGTNNPACGRIIPNAAASQAVEALEMGFHHGFEAALQAASERHNEMLKALKRELVEPLRPPEVLEALEEHLE